MTGTPSLSALEVLGLSPFGQRGREALRALRGDPWTPKTRFGLSSLRILRPRLAVPLWLGRRARGRLVPIYNLFNHTRPPLEDGWSVRKTRVRDFRGGTLSYDSHNGTDFAVPPGTVVVAAAPGRVLRISSEFDRGGLKVFIDHGGGLVTTSNHLARALVSVGDRVVRGQPVALSGMSGIDGLVTFPWSTPHVHFNVWLGGEYVDPFPYRDARDELEPSLWRTASPTPHDGRPVDEAVEPTAWDLAAVDTAIATCRVPAVQAELRALEHWGERAMSTLFQRLYYPTRFPRGPALIAGPCPRTPRLDLPFRAQDFDGVWFPDEAR